jgi:hypothetical protein
MISLGMRREEKKKNFYILFNKFNREKENVSLQVKVKILITKLDTEMIKPLCIFITIFSDRKFVRYERKFSHQILSKKKKEEADIFFINQFFGLVV